VRSWTGSSLSTGVGLPTRQVTRTLIAEEQGWPSAASDVVAAVCEKPVGKRMEAAARHSARAALFRQRRRMKIASGGIHSACPGSRATDPSRAAERSRCEARQARVKGRAETNARCSWLVPPVSRREGARPASEGCLARRYSKSAAKDPLRPQEQCRTAHAEDAQAVLEDRPRTRTTAASLPASRRPQSGVSRA